MNNIVYAVSHWLKYHYAAHDYIIWIYIFIRVYSLFNFYRGFIVSLVFWIIQSYLLYNSLDNIVLLLKSLCFCYVCWFIWNEYFLVCYTIFDYDVLLWGIFFSCNPVWSWLKECVSPSSFVLAFPGPRGFLSPENSNHARRCHEFLFLIWASLYNQSLSHGCEGWFAVCCGPTCFGDFGSNSSLSMHSVWLSMPPQAWKEVATQQSWELFYAQLTALHRDWEALREISVTTTLIQWSILKTQVKTRNKKPIGNSRHYLV